MEDYQHHVRDVRTCNIEKREVSYCGVPVTRWDKPFEDATHAIATIQSGNMLQPCPDCVAKMIEILKQSV